MRLAVPFTLCLLNITLATGCIAATIAANSGPRDRLRPRTEGAVLFGAGLASGALATGILLNDGCKSSVEPVSLSGMPSSGHDSSYCVPAWGGYVVAPFAVTELFAGSYQLITGKYLFKTKLR